MTSGRKTETIQTLEDLAAALTGGTDVDLVAEEEIAANSKRADVLLGKLVDLSQRDLRAEEKRRERQKHNAIGSVLAGMVKGAAEKESTDDNENFLVPMADDTRACARETSEVLRKLSAGYRSKEARTRAQFYKSLDELEVGFKKTFAAIDKMVANIRTRQSTEDFLKKLVVQ